MKGILLQLIMAWLGSAGFCLLFHLRKELLFFSSLGGLFGWGVYLFAGKYCEGIFFPTLVASAFCALYAEIFARVMKTPATLFFIPAAVPLIPGSTLYYTMSYAVGKQWELAGSYGFMTLQYALGIAAGISLIWAICDMERKLVNKWKQGE